MIRSKTILKEHYDESIALLILSTAGQFCVMNTLEQLWMRAEVDELPARLTNCAATVKGYLLFRNSLMNGARSSQQNRVKVVRVSAPQSEPCALAIVRFSARMPPEVPAQAQTAFARLLLRRITSESRERARSGCRYFSTGFSAAKLHTRATDTARVVRYHSSLLKMGKVPPPAL